MQTSYFGAGKRSYFHNAFMVKVSCQRKSIDILYHSVTENENFFFLVMCRSINNSVNQTTTAGLAAFIVFVIGIILVLIIISSICS